MTEEPEREAVAQLMERATAMAALMNDNQKDRVVAAMLIDRTITVLQSPPNNGVYTVESPFNAGAPISILSTATTLLGVEQNAAVIFDGDGTDTGTAPEIVAILYNDRTAGFSAFASEPTPDTSERVQRLRAAILTTLQEAADRHTEQKESEAGA